MFSCVIIPYIYCCNIYVSALKVMISQLYLIMLYLISQLYLIKSAIGQSTFKYAGAKDWNSLPSILREITTITSFKRSIYMYLLETDNKSHFCSV